MHDRDKTYRSENSMAVVAIGQHSNLSPFSPGPEYGYARLVHCRVEHFSITSPVCVRAMDDVWPQAIFTQNFPPMLVCTLLGVV